MDKNKKFNLFRLAEKGLVRFKFWFILKLLIIFLWGLLVYNFYMILRLDILPLKNDLNTWVINSLIIFINFFTLVFILIITAFTLRMRKNEFGLYRCSGGTRSEIFILILNESIILSLLCLILIIILESFLIFYFRAAITDFFKMNLDFSFVMQLLQGFGLFSIIILIGMVFCYIPFGLYYSFNDPYNVIKN